MARTVLQIKNNVATKQPTVVLKDANGTVYKTYWDLLDRLKKLRAGTVVKVENENIALGTNVDYSKSYYVAFDSYGYVTLIYVNATKHSAVVIAKAKMSDLNVGANLSNEQFKVTMRFIHKLGEVCGTLRVLNFDDGDKRGYSLYHVTYNKCDIDEDGRYSVDELYAAEQLKIPYRNLDGKLLSQTWVSLEDAVCKYAMRLEPVFGCNTVVCTEHGTVVFMI